MLAAQTLTILQAVATVGWAGTAIPPSNVYVRKTWLMVKANLWPAMNVTDEDRDDAPDSFASFIGGVPVTITLYDTWTEDNSTLEERWEALDAQMEIVMSNLEGNTSLVTGNLPNAVSIHRARRPGYAKGITADVLGKRLVFRAATLSVAILPYAVP